MIREAAASAEDFGQIDRRTSPDRLTVLRQPVLGALSAQIAQMGQKGLMRDQTGLARQLGQLLTLVEATEHADQDALAEAQRRLPAINARLLDSRLAQAMAWANNVGREQDSSK